MDPGNVIKLATRNGSDATIAPVSVLVKNVEPDVEHNVKSRAAKTARQAGKGGP